MTSAYILTGTVTDPQTLRLNEPLPVSTGEVRVTVEVLTSAKPALDFESFLATLREGQAARGHVPRTREEIDEAMREERAGWDDRP